MKKAIITAISEALTELNIGDIDIAKIVLERPADMQNGDYATSAALVFAPKAGKKPLVLAVEILEKLREKKAVAGGSLADIQKMEVAGPGFINFYISENARRAEVSAILEKKDKYGTGELEVGKKIAFEYTDPNPFKVFHIGHLMSNTIGESLARIAEAEAAEVKRFCYQGDVGRHVALTIWGLRFMPKGENSIPKDDASLSEKVAFFGKAYAVGATKYKKLEEKNPKERPESPEFIAAKAELREINKKIYEKSDEEINGIYDKGREWSLEHFEELYKILGTKFDQYFFESAMAPIGMKIVEENTKPAGLCIFEESQGAIIFPGEKYGLHTRVFITTDKAPLYEAKEMGLAVEKYKAYKYDRGITVTANEQDDYFKVVLKATNLLFPEIGAKAEHVSHGMLRLTSGKMSSRTGDVISGEQLVEEMIAESLKKMKEREMTDTEKRAIAEQVGVAAIKYTVLRQNTGKNIIFDPEKSLSFEGDSGPYLQYAVVRANAVLAKAEKEGVNAGVPSGSSSELDAAGVTLEKLLGRFPEVVERSWLELAPHYIATYITELAASFNSFYASTQIVKADDEVSPYKVAMTEAFSIIMKNGLNLLGIRVPDKM